MSTRLPVVQRLAELPAQLDAERSDTLARGARCRLEHILSGEHASPPGAWYDQAEDEWAVLLAGSATLEFEAGCVELRAGDALLIPAHLRHRVASARAATWLALHFDPA